MRKPWLWVVAAVVVLTIGVLMPDDDKTSSVASPSATDRSAEEPAPEPESVPEPPVDEGD